MDEIPRNSSSNPPSLYDTSTSTVESWSTKSSGTGTRIMAQQSNSYYSPSRNHRDCSTALSSRHLPSESPIECSDDFSPRNQALYKNNEERAYSEPGASINARYTAFLNRRFSRNNGPSQHTSERQAYAQSDIGIPDGMSQYNQQYPDPEPVASVTSTSGEGDFVENRQASSPLQPAEERFVNRLEPPSYGLPKAGVNRNQAPMPQRTIRGYETQSSPRTFVRQPPRGQGSSRVQQSPRTQPSQRVARPSPRTNGRVGASPTSNSSSSKVNFEPPMLSSQDPNNDSKQSIERPPSTTVQDLKRQLWSENEVLQVTVQPTITSPKERTTGGGGDRRRSHDPSQAMHNARATTTTRSQQRSSRSLSPGQRSSGSDGKFKSKFYEAALAARMRGKMQPPQIDLQDVPREVQQHNREKQKKNPYDLSNTLSNSTSFSEKSVQSAPKPQSGDKITQLTARTQAMPQHELNHAHGRPTEFEGLQRASSWAERSSGRAITPRTQQRQSIRKGKDTSLSKERRAGSVGREEALPVGEPPKRAPSPRRRPPSMFMEQRQREFSPERSQSTNKRPCSPFMEKRIKEFSSQQRRHTASSGPEIPYQGKALRRGSASSIEKLAREFSGDINQIVAPANADSKFSNISQPREALADAPTPNNCTPTGSQSRSVTAYWQKKADPSTPIASTKNKNQSSANVDPRHEIMHSRSASSADSSRTGSKRIVDRTVSSDGQDSRDVADLVAKLSAINRENPTEALAQIDSILRNQNHISADSETPQNSESPEQSEASDDETSVSSITNPSYQAPRHQDQVKVVSQPSYVLENNGQQETGNLAPSTSSFRRPRPSALQQYSTPAHQEGPSILKSPALTRTQEKRMHIKHNPPPTTIRVSNQTTDIISDEKKLEHETEEVSETRNTIPASGPTASAQSRSSRLDSFVSSQHELAAKIRVWDELSTGGRNKSQIKNNEFQPAEKLTNATSTAGVGRQHPWSEEIVHDRKNASDARRIDTKAAPRQTSRQAQRSPSGNSVPSPNRREGVNLKDTSMDNAFGVELQMEKSGKTPGFPKEKFNPSKKIPESLSSNFSPSNSTFTPTPRATNDFFVDTFEPDASNFFARDVSPSLETSPPVTRQQQEKTQRISDEFDAAWVSMPSASFFPGRKLQVVNPEKQLEMNNDWPDQADIPPDNPPTKSYSSKSLVDLDESFDNNTSQSSAPGLRHCQPQDIPSAGQPAERGSIEVSLLEENLPSRTTQDDYDEDGEAHYKEYRPKRRANEPKKRKGILRAFMRKEKKKDGSKPENSSRASDDNPGVRVVRNRPQPRIATNTLPPGYDQQEIPPPRGRLQNSSPRRSRSRSLERFRSKSMAQKFSRVMRLYDD